MLMMIYEHYGQFRIVSSRGPVLTAKEASRLGKVAAFEVLSLVILNVLWRVALMAHIHVFLL